MKIVLTNPPWYRDGKWGVRAGSRWPHLKNISEGDYLPFPFFLAYAAALLKENNFNVHLIDAIAEKIPEEVFLCTLEKLKPDLILAETSTVSLDEDLALLKKINKKTPIALCGPDINIRHPSFLRENERINYVLVGEYEYTFLDLVQHLKKGDDLGMVSGLIYRDKAGVKVNSPRSLIKNLDKLPWPLRDVLPMQNYLDAPGEMPTPCVQMLSSRGCPFQCIFCLWPQIMYQDNQFRARQPAKVVDEMEYLVKNRGFKSVYFDDDTFNINKKRVLAICNEIVRRKINVPWAMMARPDLMDEELLEALKSAGLHAVKYGVESGVQELVDNANKNMDLDKSERMIRLTKELGIRTHLTFTFGLPGETKKTIAKTIKYALRLDPHSVQFSITTPFPGTEYFKDLDRKKWILSKRWSDYDGNFISVIRTKKLGASALVKAKERAYRCWYSHLRKRILKEHIKNSPFSLLHRYLHEYGMKFTFHQAIRYFSLKRILDRYLKIMGILDGSYAYRGPNFVHIDLTNRCNNNCIGCWCNSPLLGKSKKGSSKILSYGLIIDLIDQLSNLGVREVAFSGGGEPFMHPHILDIIQHAKQKGLICHINTNFTLIDEELIQKLIKLKVDYLTVSLWAGSPEVYKSTHPNKSEDDFCKMVERLKSLNSQKDKFPILKLYNVLCKVNYQDIDAMVQLAIDIKADLLEFALMDSIPKKTDKILLSNSELMYVRRKAERIKERFKNKSSTLKLYNFGQFIRRVSNKFASKGEYDSGIVDSIPCYAGWDFSRIMADGNVVPCLKAHRLSVGNICKEKFSHIWNGSLQRQFRQKAVSKEKDEMYFPLIGNNPASRVGCFRSCDDLERNIRIHRMMNSTSPPVKLLLHLMKVFLKPLGQRNISYQRTGKIYKTSLLIFLFIFTLLIDTYLLLLKKIRGSIIFPGG